MGNRNGMKCQDEQRHREALKTNAAAKGTVEKPLLHVALVSISRSIVNEFFLAVK